LSSTIDRRAGERGQTLAIFAFGLIGILAVAALVFDVGQNLFDRRKQQDAADAAALAAARWLTTTTCQASPSLANCPEAVNAATDLIQMHGYDPATQADINIPPDASSQFGGAHGHVQVVITATRNSFFSGVLGLTNFQISAQGVARNTDGYSLPYSILALGKDCNKDGWVTGSGSVTIEGDIMVTGDCGNTGSLAFDGNSITANFQGQCLSSGGIDYGPSGSGPMCAGGDLPDAEQISDPLSGLMPPNIGGTTVPNPPLAPVVVAGTIDDGMTKLRQCPRQTRAGTATLPRTCNLEPGASGTNVVRIYPGVYYGGISIKQTNAAQHLVVYLEPGIYYMAGGGFSVAGDVEVYTVDAGGTSYGAAGTSGVMIFNSHNPSEFSQCESGSATASGVSCARSFDVQNTATSVVKLRGYAGPVYTTLILFQDRRIADQTSIPVKLSGNANLSVEGTFYLPKGLFDYAGNGSGEVLHAQVICQEFKVSGGGSLAITYTPDDALKVSGTGLVE
jgi:hypothetical protein